MTLLIMGVATVGVGLIPSTAAIGLIAPLLLVALRLAQGFAVGGEWAGSVLLGVESAPTGRRGCFGMFTQLGLGTALVLYRYTGTALAHNIGGIVGGRIPPVVSPALLNSHGSWAIGAMMCGLTIVGLVSVILLGRTTNSSPKP